MVAESTSVRFRLTSVAISACGMLRAGETYKALRGTIKNDPQNETKDSANLVIYNNEKNMPRDNAVFDVDLEEEIIPR